ncbi:related to YTP1 [Cephalotrichum gorgonifer]|uniref:Related to YTP1 n=1 Tax=Cephalotrichum gorgonifer TaxID=2041049 RepID=A0AAE8N486_9PEZI|nr:related to YTP1 [Cephalotrichum gorgonifer]
MGWIATIIVGAHVFLHLLDRATGFAKKDVRSRVAYRGLRSPMSPRISTAGDRRMASGVPSPHRPSYDSGHGTDRLTESLRSSSISEGAEDIPFRVEEDGQSFDEEDLLSQDEFLARESRPSRWNFRLPGVVMGIFRRGRKAFRLWYGIVDRVILLLGFATFCTGVATFARFFEGHAIFGGLAHWIKGGVFFWIGIFTLGRWSGSFGDLGWAWNIRPRSAGRKWKPSAEFVESALIFFYGSTNIFLEHLGGWGGDWSAQDLEHISITVLFIGGGLCGMLIESSKIRDLLNTTASEATESDETGQEAPHVDIEKDGMQGSKAPDNYGVSLNPIPALVIILLGIMMSSHHQHSMISTMVHKQWGNLLVGGGLARGFTYVLMYLKPPRSVLPSRPPTELLASFGLISGGIIFMASSSDTVEGMENNGLDAMFMYTVTMGLVGILMAWVLFLLALKGWAVRRETVRMATRA